MKSDYFSYELLNEDKKTGARAGLLHTPHGDIETPIFMPVGTCGSVKGVHFSELEKQVTDTQLALCEVYELMG